MAYRNFVAVLVLCSLAWTVTHGLSKEDFRIFSTKQYAYPGDNVTFTCEVKNFEQAAVGIIFGKEFIEDSTIKTQIISSNDIVNGMYKQSGRFLVSKGEQDGLTILTLKILNVSPLDNGLYVCAESGALVSVNTPLFVYRKPEAMSITQNEEELTDNMLMFERNTPQQVACTFDFVNPKPEIKVSTINNNYSNQFSKHIETGTPCSEPGFASTCILEFYYNVTVYKDDFLPSGLDHGEELTCTAWFADTDISVQVQAKLDIKFDPMIQCEHNQMAHMHDKNVEIFCYVYANPMVTTGIHWQIPMGEGTSENLSIDGVHKEYRATSEDMSPTQKKVMLIIDQMMEQHIQEYTLVVENGTMPITHTVALTEKAGETASMAADINTVWTAMVSVFAAVTAILVYSMK